MQERTEQHLFDKHHLPDGAWKNEPDRVSWVDQSTGYHCLIRRNDTLGFLCGYVSIDKNHPYYEQNYMDNNYKIAYNLDVHGGITYTEPCQGDPEEGICHLTKDGDHAWWIGFDCAHGDDLSPGIQKVTRELSEFLMMYRAPEVYRDMNYVISEVESLARQLKDIEKKGDK